jgi:hypothetical protein
MSKQLLSGVNGAPSVNTVSYPQLPENVRRRVRAVKNLLAEINKIDVNYYKELHALEQKYQSLKQPLHDKRSQIVTGKYEPSGSETEFPEEFQAWELNNQTSDDKGIPKFWLTAFLSFDQLTEVITEKDEEILKHLQDVRLTTSSNGFKLDFVFEQNEFFSNSVLSKTYELKFDVDSEDVLGYAGPEVVKAIGTEIQWKSDEVNPTIDAKRRANKAKNRQVARNGLGLVKAESFFHFFEPPTGKLVTLHLCIRLVTKHNFSLSASFPQCRPMLPKSTQKSIWLCRSTTRSETFCVKPSSKMPFCTSLAKLCCPMMMKTKMKMRNSTKTIATTKLFTPLTRHQLF